jgi:hypothetical protein
MDWEWRAFLEPLPPKLVAEQSAARDAGFHHADRVTCSGCEMASYSLWVKAGAGANAPSASDWIARARGELERALLDGCPDHVDFYRKP